MTRRVALASIAVVCFVMLLLGGSVYLRFAHDLNVADDHQLTTLAARPASLLARPGSTALAQLRGPAGAIRLETPALLLIGALPPETAGYRNVRVDRIPLRVLTRVLPGGRTLSVAIDRTTTEAALRRLGRELIIGTILGALLAAVALVLVTRRALAPVRRAAEVADRIARTSDLRTRVPVVRGRDEVARLTSSMNRMLERVEASDDALRRLVGDASHELRNPLTSLRGNLELLTGDAPVTEAHRVAALEDARAETEHLEQLVEDLLALARADAAPAFAEVPVAALIAGLPEDRITVAADLAGAALAGDRPSLLAMVRNLTANADRYAGGWTIELDRRDSGLELRVIDHGPGIPVQERSRVFERFARASAAAGSSGSGIGLAIVAAVARAHGGQVNVEDTAGGGATFVVRLPLIAPG